jgi:hypothetical protein
MGQVRQRELVPGQLQGRAQAGLHQEAVAGQAGAVGQRRLAQGRMQHGAVRQHGGAELVAAALAVEVQVGHQRPQGLLGLRPVLGDDGLGEQGLARPQHLRGAGRAPAPGPLQGLLGGRAGLGGRCAPASTQLRA